MLCFICHTILPPFQRKVLYWLVICILKVLILGIVLMRAVRYGVSHMVICMPVLCWFAAAAKSLQSCPTLCDPRDGSPPGSAVPGILQARTLEWVAISFSSAWKWKVKGKLLSRVRLFTTPWIVAHQAPPSMGFSRQEYWSVLPLPSPKHQYKQS